MSERARGQARMHIAQHKQAARRLRALVGEDTSRTEGLRKHYQAVKDGVLRTLHDIDADLALAVDVESDIGDDLAHSHHFSPPGQVTELMGELAIAREEIKRRLEFLSTIPDRDEDPTTPEAGEPR